ncbi:hypothetical protein ACFW04_004629 [Cataglyphis niger]
MKNNESIIAKVLSYYLQLIFLLVFFLSSHLNGETYLNFLKTELPILLEDVPLGVRMELIFQYDGAPAHFARRIYEHLNMQYLDRWIGQGGPIIWPARSPDLNVLELLDYFV